MMMPGHRFENRLNSEGREAWWKMKRDPRLDGKFLCKFLASDDGAHQFEVQFVVYSVAAEPVLSEVIKARSRTWVEWFFAAMDDLGMGIEARVVRDEEVDDQSEKSSRAWIHEVLTANEPEDDQAFVVRQMIWEFRW